MNHILLIDGFSIINRAFYGVPKLNAPTGEPTNGIYGFLNILFKVMEEESPTHIGVAFDLPEPTFRHQMYPEYKGTRKGMPEELLSQVPVLKEVLKSMGIIILEKPGFEADDLIGTISHRFANEKSLVSILSGDRDLLQLVTPFIKMKYPTSKGGKQMMKNYVPELVLEDFGVTPKQIVDLKGLMGDSSDNIPGLPGIGEKTALKLIQAYHSLEACYDHIDELSPNRVKNAFIEHGELGKLSKTLATIDTKVDYDIGLEDLEIDSIFTPEAYEMYQKLGFKNLLERFEVEKERKDIFFEWVEIEKLEEILLQKKPRSVAFNLFNEEVDILSLNFDEKTVYGCINPSRKSFSSLLTTVNSLTDELYSTGVKYWYKWLNEDVDIVKVDDFELIYYLLDPNKSEYLVEDASLAYLGRTLKGRKELLGKVSLEKALKEDKENLEYFLSEMMVGLLSTMPVMKKKLIDEGMEFIYQEIEKPLIKTLAEMELAGIKVDRQILLSQGEDLAKQISVIEKKIFEAAGEEFNINSPKQLGVILFEKLNLPGAKKTKSGYSTAADVLDKLAPEYEIVRQILEYRQYSKLKSTYADGLLAYIEADGRIHSNFRQTVAATGRISSTDPNLQNIPIRMELGRRLRKAMVPKEGYLFLDADYSQIELRVLAHLSKDEKLIDAFVHNKDIHRMTASEVFGVAFDEVTDLQRRNAKAVNFGIIYGISAFSLSEDLSMTMTEAKAYMDHYFKTFPKINAYLKGLVKSAKDLGYSETFWGRRRPVDELKSSNFMQRAFGERIAMNAPIQGSAADIMKKAMNDVSEALKLGKYQSRVILQVHDELLLEVKEEELEAVQRILKEKMEEAAALSVPLKVDMSSGKDWFEVK